MKILVTGAAGFIGSNFVYYMLDTYDEIEIVGLDILTYAGNMLTIKKAMGNERFRFYKEDITNRKNIFSIFDKEKFDVVINFAAESHVDRSIKMPGVFIKTNVIGTQVLLDASLKYGVKRFHQISTDEVYGQLADKEQNPFLETNLLNPTSPYAASKASADLLVLSYFRTFELPVTISRCSNNYGPYQFPEKLIPLAILHAIQNKPIPIYGTGLNMRDWIYVTDHCVAIDKIVQRGHIGEIYNIGGKSEQTNIDVVKKILFYLNTPESLIQYVTDRKGHDFRYAVSNEKINNIINWEPLIPFDEGLYKTVIWFKENIDWCMNVLEKQA